ncbi:MAG TPA: hemerythrin domain-containing protein [Polyangia bacterium]|nr:hemerythrin domain-containing protein [Polyangia bacterium]
MDARAKGMGAIKEVKATLEGLTGLFRTLAKEHGEARVLLKGAAKSSNDLDWKRVFPNVRAQLLAHERGEMAVLYPKLLALEETRPLAEDHNREAKEMESLIEALNADGFGHPERQARVQRLLDLVDHHANEEESSYFRKAQDALGKDAAKQLEGAYLSKKDEILRDLG